MKLSASNIAWQDNEDESVYQRLKLYGFSGIEIAPTRLVPSMPYHFDNRDIAKDAANTLRTTWGLSICSAQSILYGIKQRLFGNVEEREFLFDYTCAAVDFAADIGCPHVVFGSPRNRVLQHPSQRTIGEEFFTACARHAEKKGVIIGIEANPASYGTNYLNTTKEALALVKAINSPSFRLNLDLGAILENGEELEYVEKIIDYVSHVHISEPSLSPIIHRLEHENLAAILRHASYDGWVSIEMKNSGRENLYSAIELVSKAFSH